MEMADVVGVAGVAGVVCAFEEAWTGCGCEATNGEGLSPDLLFFLFLNMVWDGEGWRRIERRAGEKRTQSAKMWKKEDVAGG